MTMHNPKCPSCDGKYGSYSATCSDVNPVGDCKLKFKHSHEFCANKFCKVHWIEFELGFKMLKTGLKITRKVKSA